MRKRVCAVCDSALENAAEIFLVEERRRKNQKEHITSGEENKIHRENNQPRQSLRAHTALMGGGKCDTSCLLEVECCLSSLCCPRVSLCDLLYLDIIS